MFWRFAFQSNSNSLDNLIDKYLNNLQQKNNNPSFNPTTQSSTPSQQNNNNVELSTILLEEEFLPQLKKGSEKLIELLINPQVLSKLFSIILREPQTSPNFISNTQSKERSSEDSTSSANSNLEDNNLKSEKLYNIALEVLSIDNDSITTSILADPNQSLMKLWEILSQKPSIDPALSTSFARVFGGLLTRKTKETLEFIFNQKNALNCILTHFENPIIMDLLLKLICLEEIPEGMGVVDWLHKEGLIKKLVDRLAPSALPNTHSETSQVILHIVAISQCTSADQFSIGINPLIEELVSEEVVKTIVNYMLKPCSENIDSCLTFGVTIFIEIIRRNYIEGEFEIPPPSSRYHGQRIPANLGNLVKILTENLENFLNLLKNPRKVNKVKNSSGEFIPLGFERLKVCELIAELLHCSNMLQLSKIECPLVDQELESFLKLRDDNLPTQKVNDESAKDKAEEKTEAPKVENTQYQSSYFDQFNDSLISSSTSLTAASKEALNNSMEKLSISNDSGVNSNFLSLGNWTKLKFLELNISSIFLDLFFQYELNNFLHVVVFDLIHQLLNLTLDNKVNICLLRDLFIDCKLIARIIDAQKVNDDFINTRGGYRLGYMGHLTFIAEETVKHLERIDLELGFEVKDIKTSKEWEDYSKLSLKETKQRDLEPLDGNFSANSTVLDKDLPKLPSPTTNNITTTTNNNVKKTFKTNSPPEFSKNDDINKQQLAKFLSQPESLNQVHGGIIEDGVDWDEEEDEEDDQQNSDQDLNFIKVDKRSIVESNNSGDDSDIDKGDESDDKLLPLSAPSSTKVINGVESDNLNHSSNSSTSKKYRRFSLGSIDPSLAESLSSEFLVSSPTAQFFGSQNIPIKALPTTQTNNELAKMEFYPTQKEAISNKMKSQTLPPIRKHVRRRSISSIIVPSLKSLKDQAKSGDWQSIFKLREYDEGYPSASGEPNCPSFTSAPPPAPKPDRKSKREDFLNGIKMHSRSNSTYF